VPSQSPVWVPLLVAFVGLASAAVGAVVAVAVAVLTQLFTQRREREQEALRWQREREERREHWEREDAERWRRDRRAAYAELLVAVERWLDVARVEKPHPLTGRREVSREGQERLRAAHAEIDKAQIAVELLAPESIRGRVRALYVATGSFPNLVNGIDRRPDEEIEHVADEWFDKIARNHQTVRELIRKDLGIEPQHAVG
jgi:hypothetical protein